MVNVLLAPLVSDGDYGGHPDYNNQVVVASGADFETCLNNFIAAIAAGTDIQGELSVQVD